MVNSSLCRCSVVVVLLYLLFFFIALPSIIHIFPFFSTHSMLGVFFALSYMKMSVCMWMSSLLGCKCLFMHITNFYPEVKHGVHGIDSNISTLFFIRLVSSSLLLPRFLLMSSISLSLSRSRFILSLYSSLYLLLSPSL